MEKYRTVVIDKNSLEHLYIQLYKNMRMLIFNSVLKPHDKLPPIRKMAEFLGVNNVTVVNAYKLLEEDALVYKKIGSGTYVSPVENEYETKELVHQEYIDYKYDFSVASPTPELFPVEDFKWVLNEVLERDKGYAFGYQESKGFLPFRQSLCHYMNKHSVQVQPEDIQIISGAQQGIDLVSKSVLDYGDTVIVESPTYTGAIANFKLRGANIVEIPMTENGIELSELKAAMKRHKPKLLYLMPNCQNPTGISYDITHRQEVVELAKQHNCYILEDDYATDLYYGDDKPTPLKAEDTYDRIIYIKSFSKVLMPGLRLGFMIVPSALTDEIAMAKHTADITTSGLIQRAFDLYIRKGYWDQQIERINKTFKKRFVIMSEALETCMPDWVQYDLPRGGFNFWLTMTNGLSADELCWRLSEKGISIVSGSVFYSMQNKSSSFRISIAGISTKDIHEGVKAIADELNEMNKSQTSARSSQKHQTIL